MAIDGTGSGEVTLSVPGKPDLTGTYEGVWHGKIKSGPMVGMMQWPEAEKAQQAHLKAQDTPKQ
jgi:hypothetical protein